MTQNPTQARRSIFPWNRCELTGRDRHNQNRIRLWGLTWIGSFLVILWAIRASILPSGIPTLALILISASLGLKTILTYRHFLSEADELRRKIEVDALAFGFGVGIVGAFSFQLLQRTGSLAEEGIPILLILMMLAFLIGKALGHRRYS